MHRMQLSTLLRCVSLLCFVNTALAEALAQALSTLQHKVFSTPPKETNELEEQVNGRHTWTAATSGQG